MQDLVEPLGVETVALLAEATLESLQRLTDMPAGTPVGVVGWGQTCMENLSRSIEGAGLDHLEISEAQLDDGEEAMRVFLGGVKAVVCSTATGRRLREITAGSGVPLPEIIEEDRTLDKGGVEMLGRMLRQYRPQNIDA